MNIFMRLIQLSLLAIVMMTGALPVLAQFTFDKPKAEQALPNPYTMGAPREQILEGARAVLKACAIEIDDSLSRPSEGKIVTKPLVFSRGVTVRNDLEFFANFPAGDVRNWSQARFSLEITAVPKDQKESQLLINANLQGRLVDVNGSLKWVEAKSNGRLEDEVMRGMAGKILGIDLSRKGTTQRRLLNCEY